MSIYDLPVSRTEHQIEAWMPLVDWIKGQLNRVRDLDVGEAPVELAVQPAVVQGDAYCGVVPRDSRLAPGIK